MFSRCQKYCRNLSSLSLAFVEYELGAEVLDLTVSYSTQLLKLTMGPECFLNPFQVEEVAQKCPFSDFSLSCWWVEVSTIMLVIKERLVSLKISDEQEECGEEEFIRLVLSGIRCTRLRKIFWEPDDEDDCGPMQAILLGAHTTLHELHATIIMDQAPSWLGARTFYCTSALRKFHYRGVATHVFDLLAKKNPTFETVEICTNLDGRNEEFCLHVVESFACCSKLRDLFVSTYEIESGSETESSPDSAVHSGDEAENEPMDELSDENMDESEDGTNGELHCELEAMNDKLASVQAM